jgi:hypothetical protein
MLEIKCTALPQIRLRHRILLVVLTLLLSLVTLVSVPTDVFGAETFPRLANIYFGSLDDIDLELMARWDVLVLSKRSTFFFQSQMDSIRALNPDIRILVHMPIGYWGDWLEPPVNAEVVYALNENNWWMLNTEGERAMMDFGSSLINVTTWCPENGEGQKLCDWLPQFIAENVGPGGAWDGIFLDYCMDDIAWANAWIEHPLDANLDGIPDDEDALNAAWRAGEESLVANLRELVGDDYVLVTNGNNTFYDICNGSTRENFPHMHGGWYRNITDPGYGYLAIDSLYHPERVNILNSIWTGPVGLYGPLGDDTFEQKIRFYFTSALVFGDGYFSFDGGLGLPAHSQTWWHELYDIELGNARGGAWKPTAFPGDAAWVELGHMVRARRFERGVAVVNPSSSSQNVRLAGFYYDQSSWNGMFYSLSGVRQEVTIPSCSGDILIGSGWMLEAPAGLAAAALDAEGVRVSWDRVPGASSYAIYRSHSGTVTGNPRALVAVVEGYSFLDREAIPSAVYYYEVAPIDAYDCEGRASLPVTVSMAPEDDPAREERIDGSYGRETVLLGCAPHPIRDSTTIQFDIADDERWAAARGVTLIIYDVVGRVVRRLLDEPLEPGSHFVEWDGTSDEGARVSSGCYFYALSLPEKTFTGKMLVIN